MTEASIANSGMAVAIDVNSDPRNVHPTNKQEIARRLSLVARARVYSEKKLSHSGPRLEKTTIENNAMRLKFSATAGGLKTGDGKVPGEFVIAGGDRKWFEATAKIEGDSVIVSSPEVASPVAVRYAWKELPIANLIGGHGLPASPFRTDSWDGMTKGYTAMYFTQIGLDDETMTTP